MRGTTGKWMAMGLVVALSVSLLAACSSNKQPAGNTPANTGSSAKPGAKPDKKLEDYTDEMKITAYQGARYAGPSNGPTTEYAKYVKQKFKINVDGFVWPAGEDGQKKVSLIAASGEMPDIIQYKIDPPALQIYQQMADAGMLLDIEPYLKNTPDITKYYTKTILDSFRNPTDGKLYILPGFTVNPDLKDQLTIAVNDVLMIREDWLKKLNLEAPKTPDEFYNVLKAFKSLPPVNGKPVVPYLPLTEGQEINYHIGGMFGIHRYKDAHDDNEKRMVDYHEKPEYVQYLKFASKLFREGLIDPEAYKLKWQQAYNDMIPKGNVGIASMWPNDIAGFNLGFQKTDPNAKYVPFPLPKAPGVQNSQIERINTLGTSGIVISKKVSDPERLFKYLNWMNTNEGWATVVWGPPSKDNGAWYIADDGKLIDNLEVDQKKTAENPKWGADVLGAWAYGLSGILKYTHDLVLDKARPMNEMRALAKKQYADEIFMDTVYDIYQNTPPGPVRKAKGVDLDKIFKETEARIIMTSKDDADVEKMYNAMMEQAKKADLIDIMKEDYGRYMAVKAKYK